MANKPKQARLRVNRTASLSLSTTWQKIDFNGTSLYNVNTFGKDPSSQNQIVSWDSTLKQFRFYDKNDQNFLLFVNLMTTTNLISTRASLQLRLVIPNGGGAGVNSYFPFPEEGGMVDVGEATLVATSPVRMSIPIPLYLDHNMRSNGFWIELKLSNTLVVLGVATLNNCSLLIQSTK